MLPQASASLTGRERKRTVIPARPRFLSVADGGKIRNAAAYGRVSTDSAEQETSIENQVSKLETIIKSDPTLNFVKTYIDDGYSGTNVEKRKAFLQMIDDAVAGKIDVIYTKSVSRFARNIADLLKYINMLRDLPNPVEIVFESDHASSFGATGQLILTILGICAEEESRIKSESVLWAIGHLFEKGDYYYHRILGYTKEKGRGKKLEINEEEAKTVCLCYTLSILGYSLTFIASKLNALNLPNKYGKVCWTAASVANVLLSEKYCGDIIAQKTVTLSYRTHKVVKNNEIRPQYHEEGHHDAIVPPLAYTVVKKIVGKRKGIHHSGYPTLNVIPDGIFRGFVIVDKNNRNYSLNDYIEASTSVLTETEELEIALKPQNKSIFNFTDYEIASPFLFDSRHKAICQMKKYSFSFNGKCKKLVDSKYVEVLFHPLKSIIAVRPGIKDSPGSIEWKNSNRLSDFMPVALQSVGFTENWIITEWLKKGLKLRTFGTRRKKDGECVMLFDLNDAEFVGHNKTQAAEYPEFILPQKYIDKYGDEFYQNLVATNLHRIDVDGLWQALYESKPTDSLSGQLIELAEFCDKSLDEFGLKEELNGR